MRVFTSHTVPDPIIHNAAFAAEDLSSAIGATRAALMPIFETLETIEHGALDGTLIKDRAIAASNQLSIIEERLQSHSDMAYAIHSAIEQEPEPKKPVDGDEASVFNTHSDWVARVFNENDASGLPSASTIKRHMDRLRWREAVEAYEREIAAEKVAGMTDTEIDTQADRTMAAYHCLLRMRAPNAAEARRKLAYVRAFECGSPSDLAWQSILADMEALIAAA